MIYVRTVKYHVTIKGVVNLYFPVKSCLPFSVTTP